MDRLWMKITWTDVDLLWASICNVLTQHHFTFYTFGTTNSEHGFRTMGCVRFINQNYCNSPWIVFFKKFYRKTNSVRTITVLDYGHEGEDMNNTSHIMPLSFTEVKWHKNILLMNLMLLPRCLAPRIAACSYIYSCWVILLLEPYKGFSRLRF